jgi:hypothetical protein
LRSSEISDGTPTSATVFSGAVASSKVVTEISSDVGVAVSKSVGSSTLTVGSGLLTIVEAILSF